MLIPKQITVGFTNYKVTQPETLPYARMGHVNYDTQTIKIALRPDTTKLPPYTEAERSETFWHELTHAILYDMDHPLYNNETFVTRFSGRLAKAIRTARL